MLWKIRLSHLFYKQEITVDGPDLGAENDHQYAYGVPRQLIGYVEGLIASKNLGGGIPNVEFCVFFPARVTHGGIAAYEATDRVLHGHYTETRGFVPDISYRSEHV